MLPTLRRSSSARSGICEPSTDHETGQSVRHAAVLTRRWRGAGWLTETGWCCGWSECGWSGTQDAAGAPPEPAAAGWSRRSTARVRTGGTIFETGPDDDRWVRSAGSQKGLTVKVTGYSAMAGFVVTVIVAPKERPPARRWWGCD